MMPAQFEYDYLLHPSTLDVALQTTSQAIEHARMGSGTESMVVRVLIHDLRIKLKLRI